MIGAPVNLGTVTSTASVGSVGIVTTGAVPAGGTILVSVALNGSGSITAVSDSGGNVYLAATAFQTSAPHTLRQFYSPAIAAPLPSGATITVTFGSVAATAKMASAVYVSGLLASPFDTQPTAALGTGTAPSITGATLAQGAELVVGVVGIDAGAGDTFIEAGGWTSLAPASSTMAMRWAYQIVSTTTAPTYAPTLGTSRAWAVDILSFKGADPLDGQVTTDWPNPGRAVVRRLDHVTAAAVKLIGRDQVFGAAGQPPANLDQPNPVRATVRRSEHTAGAAVNLIGRDRFFGLLGSPNFDQPNPVRGRVPLVPDVGPGTLLTLTLAATAVPFTQRDWPAPRGAPPTTQLRGFTASVDLNLMGRDAFFGLAGSPNFDQPNPVLAIVRPQDHPRGAQTQLIGQDNFTAGRPLDWPNPVLAGTLNFAERGFAACIDLSLLGKDQFFDRPGQPPANTDWPNPTRAVIRRADHWRAANLHLAGLDALPFRQGDWPLPVRAGAVNYITRDLAQRLYLLAGKDGFTAGRLLDQPNPTRPVVRRADHWRGLAPQLIGADTLPARQRDWPNPTPRIVRRPDEIRRSGMGLLGFNALPIGRLLDWANPITPRHWGRDPLCRDNAFNPPNVGDVGETAARTLKFTGASADAAASYSGLIADVTVGSIGASAADSLKVVGRGDDPWFPSDLNVGGGLDLNVGGGTDLAVNPGLRFSGTSASKGV